MAKNYYAVWSGRKPGIYESWDEAKAQVHGYPGAGFKGTSTYEEAKSLMESAGAELSADFQKNEPDAASNNTSATPAAQGTPATPGAQATPAAPLDLAEPYAFTDGSFNSTTGVFGYGGFLVSGGEKHPIQGSSDDPKLAASWNVAGETCGAMAAIEMAKKMGLDELTIYYDYEGVKKWATGEWQTKKIVSQRYRDYVENCGIKISFIHVKAHTGIPGNEEADRLAKEACGIEG